MGYPKLSYQSYLDEEEFWLEAGIQAPRWSAELYEKGYEPMTAIDFYDDLFGDDLEPDRSA